MLIIYKSESFLTNYRKLSLNERINTKHIDFRAYANCTFTDYGEVYLLELLPKVDQVR